jgi:hypothetical protein
MDRDQVGGLAAAVSASSGKIRELVLTVIRVGTRVSGCSYPSIRRSTGKAMRVRLKKRDCEEYVLRRAKRLAETGRFTGWQGIEFELRFVEGFEPARVWLDYSPFREELDVICRQAKAKNTLRSSRVMTR